MSDIQPKNNDNAPHYKWGDNADGWHLLQSYSLSVIEERVPPGASEKRHHHIHSQQFFYILEGTAHIEISGEVHEVSERNGIHVPAGVDHQLMNKQDSDLWFLVISQPKSHGDRVET